MNKTARNRRRRTATRKIIKVQEQDKEQKVETKERITNNKKEDKAHEEENRWKKRTGKLEQGEQMLKYLHSSYLQGFFEVISLA